MIKFNCPNCDQSISAETEYSGATAACPSCQHEIIVPTSQNIEHVVDELVDSDSQIQPQSSQSNKGVVKKSRNTKLIKIGVLAAICLIPVSAVVLIKIRGNSNSNSSILSQLSQTLSKKPKNDAVFWEFRFGSSYEECLETLKSLRDEGVVSDLSVGRPFGGPEDDSVISANYDSDLGGIFTYSCERVRFYFEGDKLLSVTFSWKDIDDDLHGELFKMFETDMEKFLKSEPQIEIIEDEVGDRIKQGIVDNNSLRAEFDYYLDGRLRVIAPDLRISASPN